MKASYDIKQTELCNWLHKADHHYLAARLLYLHGLLFVAEENAGFAVELLLKSACKKKGTAFNKTHKLTSLWSLAKPPINLDEGFNDYLTKLENSLYTRHPDTKSWGSGRTVDDKFGALDMLYLKLRKWLVGLISDERCTPTELDLAVKGKGLFLNVVSRHGAWDLSTILKRSNNRIDLL